MNSTKFINHEDFCSITIKIILRNLSSNTVLSSDFFSSSIEIQEALEQACVISVPHNSGTIGHKVEIEMEVKKMTVLPYFIKISGRIIECERTDENLDYIKIEFQKGSLDRWSGFLNLFMKRQESINEFIKSVKG